MKIKSDAKLEWMMVKKPISCLDLMKLTLKLVAMMQKVTKCTAGVKNMQDGNHQHLSVSKNTCDNDDTFDSGLKHLQGQLRNVLNKRNICPLSLNLRRAFLKCDAHQTGKVSRDDIKTICTRLQLNLYDGLLDKMMDRCNSDQKGNIDYSEFARHLTLPGQPISLPTPVGTASIMGYDYRPIYQRNFTDAQLLTMDEMKKKEPRPMTSHLFHTDNTAG
uniref:Uncharacterized protein LOC102809785 n=1 Tax=Saccoglossus kowalevskii TaxID=10224 RepID=A0ABM0LVQ6_SACKO|nr:PREDICTED: uncharacterized protein LOC102809785 [Saccoglossus kowalevskii]